jgi:hypothetical protein
MTIAPWSAGDIYLKINPVHDHSILGNGDSYLKINPVHDHSILGNGDICLKINPVHEHAILVCLWCLYQRWSKLKAKTKEYSYQLYYTIWYFEDTDHFLVCLYRKCQLLLFTHVHKTHSAMCCKSIGALLIILVSSF